MIHVTSTAPHKCAQDLDDARLAEMCEGASTALVWMVHNRTIVGSDELLPPPRPAADLRSVDIQFISAVMDQPVVSDGTANAGWLRMLLLAGSIEHEFRMRVRPSCAAVLDHIQPVRDWSAPECPLGVDPTDGRRNIVRAWRRDVDEGRVPIWTRRGPPTWLPAALWERQTA